MQAWGAGGAGWHSGARDAGRDSLPGERPGWGAPDDIDAHEAAASERATHAPVHAPAHASAGWVDAVASVTRAAPLGTPHAADSPGTVRLNTVRRYADHKPAEVDELVQNWRDQAQEVAAACGCDGALRLARSSGGRGVTAVRGGDGDVEEELNAGGWRMFTLYFTSPAGDRVPVAFALEVSHAALSGATELHVPLPRGSGHDHRHLVLVNFASAMSVDALQFGSSSRGGSALAAGQFGEGMKVAINILVGTGACVQYCTAGSLWSFYHDQPRGSPDGLDPFMVDVAPLTGEEPACALLGGHVRGDATYACCFALPPEASLRVSRFLFLQHIDSAMALPRGPTLSAKHPPPVFQMLLGEQHRRCIYHRGILVCKDGPKEFGIQFNGTVAQAGIDRDRCRVRVPLIMFFLPLALHECAIPDAARRRAHVDAVSAAVAAAEAQCRDSDLAKRWTATCAADGTVTARAPPTDGGDDDSDDDALRAAIQSLRFLMRDGKGHSSVGGDVGVFRGIFAWDECEVAVLTGDQFDDGATREQRVSFLTAWAAWSCLAMEAFTAMFGHDAVPIAAAEGTAVGDSRSELALFDMRPVEVGGAALYLLGSSPGCPTVERLWRAHKEGVMATLEHVFPGEPLPPGVPPLSCHEFDADNVAFATELRALVFDFFGGDGMYLHSPAQVRFKELSSEAARSRAVVVLRDGASRDVEWCFVDILQFRISEVHRRLREQGFECDADTGGVCACVQDMLCSAVLEQLEPSLAKRAPIEHRIRRKCLARFVSRPPEPVPVDEPHGIPSATESIETAGTEGWDAGDAGGGADSGSAAAGGGEGLPTTGSGATGAGSADIATKEDEGARACVEGTVLAADATAPVEVGSRALGGATQPMPWLCLEDATRVLESLVSRPVDVGHGFSSVQLPREVDSDAESSKRVMGLLLPTGVLRWMHRWADVLLQCVQCVANDGETPLNRSVFAMYHPNTQLLAFNHHGCIYLNAAYVVSLLGAGVAFDRVVLSLHVTVCHELAHNKVEEHNRAHESLMETLLSTSLAQVAAALTTATITVPRRPDV